MKSRVIFESKKFIASAMKDGSLIIQVSNMTRGKRFIDNVNTSVWIEQIENCMDTTEGDILCNHLLTKE